MKRITLLIVSIFLLASLMGCGNTGTQSGVAGYADSDVAAIIRGQEITIGDLRFMYADEDVLTSIEGAAQTELVFQEAQRLEMGEDLPAKIESVKESLKTASLADIPFEQKERDFFKSQAKKLGMNVEDYYKEYMLIRTEKDWYILTFWDEGFRRFNHSEEEFDAYNEELTEFMNEFMKKNEDDIEVLINPD